MWPFKDRQKFARQTLNDVAVTVTTDVEDKDQKSKKTPAIEVWQELVLKYANRIPIVSASCRYYNGATQRVTYDVIDANTDEPVEDANATRLVEILNAHPEEMGRAVELLFLIGEARQTFDGSLLKTHGAGELVRRGTGFVVLDYRGKSTNLPADTRAWRTWEPDRRWSDKATSSHKNMLDLLEAFVIAYAEERAVSIRLAMNTGMVLVSEEVFGLEGTDESDGSESIGSDGRTRLERRFAQMLQMVIKNPRDAASLQPPVIVVPGSDVGKYVQHVSFAQERDKRKIQERLDMLKREYAVGTDLPADIAAGFLADLNHWNARSVDDNAWKNFIAPKVQMVANNAFIELGDALGIDTSGWKVVPNGSELVEKQVQADNAKLAWDRGLISDAAARKAWGFNEDDRAEDGDGPEFPVGSQAPAAFKEALDKTRRSGFGRFAANVSNDDLRVMSKRIERGARKMRAEIEAAVMEAAEALAEDSITAAAKDPISNMRDKIVKAIMAQKEDMGLAAARALATKRAKEWFKRNETSLAKKAQEAATHAGVVVNRTVKDGTFEIGKARDIVRDAESLSSGGPKNVKANGDVNNQRPNVVQEDDDFMRMLRDEVETLTVRYGWIHGGSANPFPAHVELDGITWTIEEERDVLDNPDDFPSSATFYPGDHSGCTCSYDATYEAL